MTQGGGGPWYCETLHLPPLHVAVAALHAHSPYTQTLPACAHALPSAGAP